MSKDERVVDTAMSFEEWDKVNGHLVDNLRANLIAYEERHGEGSVLDMWNSLDDE